jgi:hypothetical protein
MSNVIDLGATLLKFKNDLEEREKIIQQQQLQIEELKAQLASISATNDLLKLLMMDIIAVKTQQNQQDQAYLQQLQDLFHKLPHIAK